MKLEVLLSCMNQNDTSIIQKTNIQTDAIIVNQCDKNYIEYLEFCSEKSVVCNVVFINTREKGLSKSRNMAIDNSRADICLFCDDDELLNMDYSSVIISEFENRKDADIIAFIIDRPLKEYSKKVMNVGYLSSLKISSVQIAFRRLKVLDKSIYFNEKMGSGTGNGAGEEIRFLYDCLKKGLKIVYVPISIGKLLNSESQWFSGFNESYFLNRGWANKMIFGCFGACLYNLYFSIIKYPIYSSQFGLFKSLYYQFKGTFQNR